MGGGTMAGRLAHHQEPWGSASPSSPLRGFAAEAAERLTLPAPRTSAFPFSTRTTITGAIVALSNARLTAVRWGVTRRIVWAWGMTIPGAALIRAGLFHLLRLVLANREPLPHNSFLHRLRQNN